MAYGNKKCPKCGKAMIQVKGVDIGNVDSSLADKWKCPNCDYEESESFFDKMLKRNRDR